MDGLATDARLEALAAALMRAGHIDEASQSRAKRAASLGSERFDFVIGQLGLAPEEAVAAAWAEVLCRPCLTEDVLAAAEIAPMVGEDGVAPNFLRLRKVVPLILGEDLVLAEGDPLDDTAAEALGFAFGGKLVRAVAAPSQIAACLERLDTPGVEGASDDIQLGRDVDRLRDMASDAPVVQWVQTAIDRAVAARASDIHIDPDGAGLSVRLRVDGELRPDQAPPPGLADGIVSRIKILARLDIAERRLPQDGRATATIRGRSVDLRVATAPTPAGETVVIRVLDTAGGSLTLDRLGFSEPVLARLRRLFSTPRGLTLVTGPTGSGKTTTLYAALRATADPRRKLITVEDPVEYALPGVTQIQANADIGLGFAAVLRSILRHNPDLVMVGEIRDRETAEMAMEAALTGHPVLSTLHTNSAVGAVTRLRDMGLPAYLIASVLEGVVAQRLLRRVCENCGGAGCATCQGTGAKGRAAAAEVLCMDAALRQAVLEGASERMLEKAATAGGMVPLAEDGLALADAGIAVREDALLLAREA